VKIRRLSPQGSKSHARRADATGTQSWTASPRPLKRKGSEAVGDPFFRSAVEILPTRFKVFSPASCLPRQIKDTHKNSCQLVEKLASNLA
jgi:hypothetical protein